ncbi:NAD-dependent epimerase/dehydratase family protein [Elioraea rosea]|uniref:NAD-dependent epimerase/dehydratase family protein n=1 Tax=Elioraea rosea TaxID=2492390 RepID=UPI001186874A|nr:NAD-dependent epimerase/dehydratase family protein [Elioraea rosea]
MTARLIVFGLGYSGTVAARAAAARGAHVTVVTRDPGSAAAEALRAEGLAVASFDAPPVGEATHLLATAAPAEGGEPVLAAHREAIAAARGLRWIGYLSTTGVYGDRGGAWVEETSTPAPGQPRSQRRLAAERAWEEVAARADAPVDLIRLSGIYGPGRSAIDEVREGTARRVIKPGHAFSRIHVEDIAGLVAAAMARPPGVPVRVLHGADDEPAASADVVAEAARLLGAKPPPAIAFEAARANMSLMALSFWSENRKVANGLTKAATGWSLRYPTYREGLKAILSGKA